MPTYRITDPTSGKVYKITGDAPPTDEEIDELIKSVNEPKVTMKDEKSGVDVSVPTSKISSATTQGLTVDSPKPVGKLESAARGIAEGATLGFVDELAAASGTYGEALDDAFGMGMSKYTNPNYVPPTRKELQQNYKQIRDDIRNDQKAAQEANPITFLGGQLAGGFAAPLPKVKVPINATSKAGKIGKAALEGSATGAIAGTVAGAGSSEAEDLDQLAIDSVTGTGIGAGIGGALGTAGVFVSPLATKFADIVQKTAKRRALGGSGAMKSNIKKLTPEQIDDAGQYLLDNPNVNSVFKGADSRLAQLMDNKEQTWKSIEDIYKFVDKYDLSKVDLKALITQIENTVGKAVKTAQKGTPAADKQEAYKRILTTFKDFTPIAKKQKGKLTLEQSQELRKQLNDFAYRGTTPSNQNAEAVKQVGEDVAGATSAKLREALQTAQQGVTAQLPNINPIGMGQVNPKYVDFTKNKDLLANYNKGVKDYGTEANLKKLLTNDFRQEIGNLPGPNLKSAVLASSNNPILQLGSILVTKPGQRGLSKVLNATQKGIRNADGSGVQKSLINATVDGLAEDSTTDNLLVNYNEQVFDQNRRRDVNKSDTGQYSAYNNIRKILDSNPEQLGKYAQPLANAVNKGEDQFRATLYILMETDPEFRKSFVSDVK